jgi:hypothetical protein
MWYCYINHYVSSLTFKRKVLGKIFGVVIGHQWRIRMNVELEKLHKDALDGWSIDCG